MQINSYENQTTMTLKMNASKKETNGIKQTNKPTNHSLKRFVMCKSDWWVTDGITPKLLKELKDVPDVELDAISHDTWSQSKTKNIL